MTDNPFREMGKAKHVYNFSKLFSEQFSKNILFITHIMVSEKVIKIRQKQSYHEITVYLMVQIELFSNLLFFSNLVITKFQFSYILFADIIFI